MTTKNGWIGFLSLLALLSLATFAPSCGPAPLPLIPLPVTSTVANSTVLCNAGQMVGPAGYCVTAVDFPTACIASQGSLITINGAQVCRVKEYPQGFNPYVQYSVLSGFFRLNSDDLTGPYAYDTGINVQPGDKLSISLTGGWGGVFQGSASVLGLFSVPTNTLNCTRFNLSGQDTSNGDAQATYEGNAAGLAATDGTDFFVIGTGSSRSIAHSGRLKVGINTAPQMGSCAQIEAYTFSVLHCVDASGNAYSCQ